MQRVRTKICGITTIDDARGAIAAGADALGFVFYRDSPRFVDPWLARQIVDSLPPFVTAVGLFVNDEHREIERTVRQCGLDLLQFHGDETPDFCASFPCNWIKALRVREPIDLAVESTRWTGARGLLLDAWQDGVPGGTGTTFRWDYVRQGGHLPVILAGGLAAHNVSTAIETVRPFAVDVSSAVESTPGRKDLRKVEAFCAAVRSAKLTSAAAGSAVDEGSESSGNVSCAPNVPKLTTGANSDLGVGR